ncbi:MAG: right-handed parallel beta-helix repeat-containing protein, partial [Bacteroidota bacterium]
MKKIASVISSLLFLHIVSSTLSAQLQTIYDKDLRSRTEEGKKSYKVPNSGYDMYSSVVYIDPSKSVNGSGTIDDPLNTWPSDLKAKTAYLQKRGTIYENDIEEQSGNYILVGAYGSGPRPRFTGDVILTGEGAVVREINISDGLLKIGKWPYTDVENCWVYDCEIKAITVFTSETKIIGNVIHNSGTDGIWTSGSTFGNYNRNIEIAYNHIYNVNMRWYPGATEKEAPGDGIQAEASGFIHIHHNIIDRSSTGSKFCIIVGHQDAAPLDALIEDNVMYSPLKTENGGAFIYLKDNVNAVIRNNKFIDMENDGLISIFAYIPSEIYGNLMVGVRRDFPPKSKAYNNTCVNVAKPNAHVELLENNILTRETSGTKGNNMYIDKAGLKNLFVDPDNGDFRLKEGSPAIGAGKKVGNWTKDMHGVKVKDQNVDMGAFVYTKNIEDNDDPTP